MRMMFGKLFWTIAEVVAVVRDVGRQQQRVAATDDALLALIGRVPVDFQLQFVGLDDLGRRGKALAELREEGDVSVRCGPIVDESGVGELLGATRDRPIDQRQRHRIVPRLRARDARDTRRILNNQHAARRAARI